MTNLKIVFWLPLFLLLGSCVSVNFAKNEVKRADDISYTPPRRGFQEFKSELVDRGWRNKTNGNAISFLSDCHNPYDPTLKAIESGVVGSIQDKSQIFSETEDFNERASLHSLYSGFVDGIPTNIELVTFKKNGCIYVLTYVAVSKHYEENKTEFSEFLRKFEAP